MDVGLLLIIIIVCAVFIFDFTNGFHDAADMVATAIASRTMTPGIAILLVTSFTFIAPFLAGLAVADTIGNFVDMKEAGSIKAQVMILSAILSAVTYNVITWRMGLPSSSTNSLVGGIVGSALSGLGSQSVNWGVSSLAAGHLEGVMKIVAGLFVSPFAGFVAGFLLMKIFMRLFHALTLKSRRFFIWSQYISISWLGFSHGANDAQKGMAIITMTLVASGTISEFAVPYWVILVCASAISLGTMFGGWRIIKTLGFGIIKVRVLHSFTDQAGAALINTIATGIGAPTSTTQVVTATLLGIGGAEKPRHVKYKTALSIMQGWLFNIPISMAIGSLYYMSISYIFKL